MADRFRLAAPFAAALSAAMALAFALALIVEAPSLAFADEGSDQATEPVAAEQLAAAHTDEIATVDYVPVYRIYDAVTGEHFYTTDKYERDYLRSIYWHYEGVGWQAPADETMGDPVYRLYNFEGAEHLYTTDAYEREVLLSRGWRDEGVAWYTSRASDTSREALYRGYNPRTGEHHYTRDAYEFSVMVGQWGWSDEGVAWYGCAPDPAFQDDAGTWTPWISGDATLDTKLERLLLRYNTLESAFDYVASFPYLSGDRFWSGPYYLPDDVTIRFANEMIDRGGGNCYRYASLFSWLARAMGYQTNVLSGWVPSYSSGRAPHGWAEIYQDGGVYGYDPDMAHENPGYRWFRFSYDSPPTRYGSW